MLLGVNACRFQKVTKTLLVGFKERLSCGSFYLRKTLQLTLQLTALQLTLETLLHSEGRSLKKPVVIMMHVVQHKEESHCAVSCIVVVLL